MRGPTRVLGSGVHGLGLLTRRVPVRVFRAWGFGFGV